MFDEKEVNKLLESGHKNTVEAKRNVPTNHIKLTKNELQTKIINPLTTSFNWF